MQQLGSELKLKQLAIQSWLTKLEGLATSQGVVMAAALLSPGESESDYTLHLGVRTGASAPTTEVSDGDGSYVTGRAFFELRMHLLDNADSVLVGGRDKASVAINKLWKAGGGLTIQFVRDLALQWHAKHTALLEKEVRLYELRQAVHPYERKVGWPSVPFQC
ncbi:hypothetical protein LTR78_005970 [Recurvomyces mirabilis]|uniref:Uncharacterized protein n=1 Tax=Recurvomyces mirabilis TaxID=574656 RepID=A0AAE1C0M5_9PEZI|nr:hypothetical protein LTR78_005970 [Recurvomyces mirabilis]KAK5155219.1 hypothetical protein LTS14_006174 [Recurvomyces mirabilis]